MPQGMRAHNFCAHRRSLNLFELLVEEEHDFIKVHIDIDLMLDFSL
jgi:hypothetical protein